MKSLINDVVNNWSVDLTTDSTLSQFTPMLNLTLVNTGDSKVEIYMHGQRIGSCFGYSVFSLIGKPFETFTVTGTFNIGDIEVIVSKMETVAVMPYNPQIDLMEENLDKFASGTDTRVSYSSLVSGDIIKYLLNTNNTLVVQRKLDVLGGASVGSYEIDFSGDIVAGSTAVNFPSVDLKRYKKTIVNSSFDYTLTNCEIKGWMLDYYKNPNDISIGYTLDAGTNGEYAYDDDISSATDYYNSPSSDGTWLTGWEVSFTERSIDEVHHMGGYKGAYNDRGARYRISIKEDNSWVAVYTSSDNDTTSEYLRYVHSITGWLKCTGLKMEVGQTSGGGISCGRTRIYDVSVF